MRPSLFSGSGGRAATYLCAACRREARATLSTRNVAAPTAAHRTLQTAAIPPAQRTTGQRWPTPTPQARYTSTSASSKPAETPSSPSNPSPIPTYYALFPETLPDGPPPTGKFPIDLRALRNEFLRLQAASHPDFHHSASQTSPTPPTQGNNNNNNTNTKSAARLHAEATSAQINAAYKTLSSPLLRAHWLAMSVRHLARVVGPHVKPRKYIAVAALERQSMA
ncbi:hypothetical protein CHGG_06004 [Chaetomium globosum CBS 148.51]|uniref:J domain-containing protein n=1 Tax=Chaetomium globosum (strain ATCC 6205 / CBS 148.51 / DSM 1962 / NBRC 6347 / NRRL 1970) TaxID=306901 RepID=Q2H5R1_CHAGB|nr:uncharacterized protein CHGG_06004 [Chaetomium globosum CBS 148.51]EAQ89385.1 hypothetical protein CHGG_06004 [Chaetomium globosum CBS 148.51]